MTDPLHEQRLKAALISKGTSADQIYRLALDICKDIDLGNDLMEFGAGTGNFVKELLNFGYRGVITCADIIDRPDSIPGNVHWIQADLNHPIPLPDQSFDTIISTEVIEHLENPRFVFREFHRLLRPGGTLIVTTPNQESLRSLAGVLVGGHFTAFLGNSYPAHISALLRLDFERICGENGFTPPRFHYTDLGSIPKLTQIRWQDISFGLLKGRLFSDTVAVVTSRP